MQTNRGVGSLATHPIAAKRFEEVGAASIIMFLWVRVQAPPSRRAGLKPSIGYRQGTPGPRAGLNPSAGKSAMREDAGWCPDGHVRRSRGSRWVVDHTECGTRATHEQMPSGAFACEPRAAAAESLRALKPFVFVCTIGGCSHMVQVRGESFYQGDS